MVELVNGVVDPFLPAARAERLDLAPLQAGPGITVAIVGGTAITGGITNPINVIFGALTVTLIPIGAAALGIPSEAQSLVYGLVIIIAVALTISRKRVGIVK